MAEEAVALASETTDRQLQAEAYGAMTHSCFLQDDLAGVVEEGSVALDLFADVPASPGKLNTLLLVGIAHRRAGDLHQAIEYTIAALDVCRDLGEPTQEANAHSNVGIMYVDLSDYDNALVHYTAALAVLGGGDDPSTISLRAGIYSNIGNAHRATKRWEKAAQWFKRAVESLAGHRWAVTAHVGANYAGALRRMGRLDECRVQSTNAVAIYLEIGGATNLGLAERLLGQLAVDEGKLEAACQHFIDAISLFTEGGHGRMATLVRVAGAECCGKLGRFDEATTLLEDAEQWATNAKNDAVLLLIIDERIACLALAGEFRGALDASRRGRELAVQLSEAGANRKTEALRNRLELQQREHENELLKRRAEELEVLVRERTVAIRAANEELKLEVEERRRTEGQLRIARDKARVADRSKTTFLAMASHELRTPLNAIKGYAEMIDDDLCFGGPVGGMREDLARILKSTDRLLSTVERILCMADLDMGGSSTPEAAFDVRALAAEVVTKGQIGALERGNELLLHADSAAEIVWGDGEKVRQILRNLVDNATKFTEHGRIDVHVSTPLIDAERVLRLEVRDTGVGFDPAILHRLTAPFAQHDTSYRRQFEGLGLGLALVHRYCEVLGGSLEVESAVGKGSRFIVTLPVAQPAAVS